MHSRSSVHELDFSTATAGHARASVVNRTHRVVRERAQAMQARRRRAQSLVLPLVICSVMLLMLCYAAWTVVTGNSTALTGLGEEAGRTFLGADVDAGGPVSVLLVWFLPVTAFTVAGLLFRRWRTRSNDEVTR